MNRPNLYRSVLAAAIVGGDIFLGTASSTRPLPPVGYVTISQRQLLGNITVIGTFPNPDTGRETRSFQISGTDRSRELTVRIFNPEGTEQAMAYIRKLCTEQRALGVRDVIKVTVEQTGRCLLAERRR